MAARATAIIPARIGSTRFPRKALAADTGKPMVVHVCERAALAESVDRVVVATDDDEIASAVRAGGFEAVMTSPDHENGTSRLAEAAEILKLKKRATLVNVQGDEPEIEPDTIEAAFQALFAEIVAPDSIDAAPADIERHQWVGTVASTIEHGDPDDPNIVKVVTSLLTADVGVGRALYFTRSLIPYDRDGESRVLPLKHIGVYAYQMAALRRYVHDLTPTPLERTERLEQLRWLEHGYPIAVAVRRTAHHGIDTPEQYAAFVERWRAANP